MNVTQEAHPRHADWESNRQLFALQDNAQPTEAQQLGPEVPFLF